MAIYIALGANLSNPQATFSNAAARLETLGVDMVQLSGLWQSPAWPPGSDQPDYINACAQVKTTLPPRALLKTLHRVEAEFGRERSVKNAARTLDLDLLDYDGQIITADDIQIPHPRMLSRGFVLFPLAEIAPNWHDPISGEIVDYFTARLPLADVAPMRRVSGGMNG